MRYVPHDYQVYCQRRIIDTPNVALWLDMGLGKTVITLSAVSELRYGRFLVRRCLVIAPKKVAESTWASEAAKWDHLRHLRVSLVLGDLKSRERALAAPADVYVINRENTAWLVDYYKSRWPFDMVVLDESSSFKNHTAVRFRALRKIRPRIARMVELTGTPSPNNLLDLWSQVYLLDGGVRLGRTISTYRDMFFVPDKRSRTTIFSYAPKDGAPDAIYRLLSDICVSMQSKDYLSLPDLITNDIPVLLDAPAQAAYRRMERDMLLPVSDEEAITASSAAVLTGKLLQLCNGAIYNEEGTALPIHDCKLDALREAIEGLNGQHCIVAYSFVHDRERIYDMLTKQMKLRRVRVYSCDQDRADWNAGLIDVLLIQPASCAYGLNLQEGGHHMIWFGLTWNLELYQQANKRLHRQGQKHTVFIHRLVVHGGADEDVIHALSRKDQGQEALLQALKARIRRARNDIA